MRNKINKMKFVSKRKVYTTYGEVIKIKTSHVGVLLDLIIPFTFGLITLFLTKKWNKELFRITKHNEVL